MGCAGEVPQKNTYIQIDNHVTNGVFYNVVKQHGRDLAAVGVHHVVIEHTENQEMGDTIQIRAYDGASKQNANFNAELIEIAEDLNASNLGEINVYAIKRCPGSPVYVNVAPLKR